MHGRFRSTKPFSMAGPTEFLGPPCHPPSNQREAEAQKGSLPHSQAVRLTTGPQPRVSALELLLPYQATLLCFSSFLPWSPPSPRPPTTAGLPLFSLPSFRIITSSGLCTQCQGRLPLRGEAAGITYSSASSACAGHTHRSPAGNMRTSGRLLHSACFLAEHRWPGTAPWGHPSLGGAGQARPWLPSENREMCAPDASPQDPSPAAVLIPTVTIQSHPAQRDAGDCHSVDGD